MGVSNPGWEERGSLPGGLLQAGTDTTPGGYRIVPLGLKISKQYISRSLAIGSAVYMSWNVGRPVKPVAGGARGVI